jgi:glycosyltransferase involved in cell wall biosynthesis
VDVPTLGLAILACNEEANLPHLFDSLPEGAFDQVALLDTGSVDRTVAVFEEWAGAQSLPLGYRVGTFTWADDFAAARNAADALLETDWLSWADADNIISGAERLRTIAHCARPEIAALEFVYDYYSGPLGRIEPRLVRRGRGRWEGRLHERLIVDGEVDSRPEDWALWIHRGRPPSDGGERNLRIARRWVEEEPDNERAVATLAREEGFRSAAAGAVGCVNNANAPAALGTPRGRQQEVKS